MSDTANKGFSHLLKWIIPLLIVGIAIVGFIVLKASKPEAPSRPIIEKRWSVQVEPVKIASYQPELIIYGQVESPQLVEVSSAVTAYVDNVAISEGMEVAEDDLLLQLDPRDAQLILQQREADLKSAQAKLNVADIQYKANTEALQIERNLYNLASKTVTRYQDLKNRKVGSDDQLDNARKALHQQALSLNNRQQAVDTFAAQREQLSADLAKNQALRDTAALDLERTKITAPFPARIASVNVAKSDRVKTGDTLLTLYDPFQLQIRAQVPSRALPMIRQALKNGERLAASSQLDGETLYLELSKLASSASNSKAGVDSLFRITSQQLKPEPGRTLSIRLVLPARPNLISIPPQALYGTDRAYRVVNDQLEAVTVKKIGDIHAPNGKSRILVESNELREGELLLATQLPNAISTLPVKVTE